MYISIPTQQNKTIVTHKYSIPKCTGNIKKKKRQKSAKEMECNDHTKGDIKIFYK